MKGDGVGEGDLSVGSGEGVGDGEGVAVGDGNGVSVFCGVDREGVEGMDGDGD